jgi:hypothetical protein
MNGYLKAGLALLINIFIWVFIIPLCILISIIANSYIYIKRKLSNIEWKF